MHLEGSNNIFFVTGGYSWMDGCRYKSRKRSRNRRRKTKAREQDNQEERWDTNEKKEEYKQVAEYEQKGGEEGRKYKLQRYKQDESRLGIYISVNIYTINSTLLNSIIIN
jgi:hypothetical protein